MPMPRPHAVMAVRVLLSLMLCTLGVTFTFLQVPAQPGPSAELLQERVSHLAANNAELARQIAELQRQSADVQQRIAYVSGGVAALGAALVMLEAYVLLSGRRFKTARADKE